MSCIDVTEFSRQKHWTAERSFLSPFIVYAACAYFEKVWGVWRKGWESVGDGCVEVWGRCNRVGKCVGGMGRVEKCGVGVEKCVGVWVRGDVGKCVGVWGRCRELLGKVWGSVCWRCGEVCWSVGGNVRKCWGRCGEKIREVWESVLGGWGEVWRR